MKINWFKQWKTAAVSAIVVATVSVSCDGYEEIERRGGTPNQKVLSSEEDDLLDNLNLSGITTNQEAYDEWERWIQENGFSTEFLSYESQLLTIMQNSAYQNFTTISTSLAYSEAQKDAIFNFSQNLQNLSMLEAYDVFVAEMQAAEAHSSSSQIAIGQVAVEGMELLYFSRSVNNPMGPIEDSITTACPCCLYYTAVGLSFAALFTAATPLGAALGFAAFVAGAATAPDGC